MSGRDGLAREGVLVMTHDQTGRVRVGEPRSRLTQRGQDVRLVLRATDEGRRERSMATKRVNPDAVRAAGDVYPFERTVHPVDPHSVVALHHLSAGGDGLREDAVEDALIEGRRMPREVDIGGEEATPDVALVDECAGEHTEIDLPALGVTGRRAPQRGSEVAERGLAGLRQQDVLREDLVEVDLERRAHDRVDGDMPKRGDGLQEAVMAAVLTIHAHHDSQP